MRGAAGRWILTGVICGAAACGPGGGDAPGTQAGPTAEELAVQWEILVETTEDPQDPLGPRIAESMAQAGPQALDPILKTLEDPEAAPRQKVLAVVSLRGRVTQEHLPRLMALLDPQQDATTRACAGELLSAARDPAVAEALRPLVEDGDSRVRLAALAGLALNGDEPARARLVELYRAENTRPLERQRVLDFLARAPREEDLPILNTAVADPSVDMLVRLNIAVALGEVGDQASISALRKASEETEEPAMKEIANQAITAIGLRRAVVEPMHGAS